MSRSPNPKWEFTDAFRYDGYEMENFIDPENVAFEVGTSDVWGAKACGSQTNCKMLERPSLKAHIHARNPVGGPMGEQASKANSRR